MKQILAATIALVALAPSAGAGENCTCRARNVEAIEGQTVCLTTANGSQMARCEKVLNNTSWKFLGTPCPLSQASPDKPLQFDVASVSGS